MSSIDAEKNHTVKYSEQIYIVGHIYADGIIYLIDYIVKYLESKHTVIIFLMKKIRRSLKKMIFKLVCPTCKCPLEYDATKTTFERGTIGSTMKQTFVCPRCKKSVELWLT